MSAAPTAPTEERDWIARSDRLAGPLLEHYGRVLPHYLSALGLEKLDSATHIPARDEERRSLESLAAIESGLNDAARKEQDPRVSDDLEILRGHVRDSRESIELESGLLVPYQSLHELISTGLAGLLDERVEPRRRRRAKDRLRAWVGRRSDVDSLVDALIARARRGLERDLLAPTRLQLTLDLRYLDGLPEGIASLFDDFSLSGHRSLCRRLGDQIERWKRFLTAELLPRAREDLALPSEIFRARLRHLGVDQEPAWIAERGRAAFQEVKLAIVPLAREIARAGKLGAADFPSVLAALKSQQLGSGALLDTYRRRIEQLDELIVTERVATLPARRLEVRLATDLETRRWPTPHYLRPRLLGNRGEHGVFVLPRFAETPDGRTMFDDFTYDAASWLVTAHEGRPGHDLQWGTILDRGTSIARAVFGLTSLNAEGWGLYVESVMYPHFPLEGRLVVLQARLLRAARVFLEPALQAGRLEVEDLRRFLREEIGLSPAMVSSEIGRYSYHNPAQSMSYFVGYNELLALRTEAELARGNAFTELEFHDSILATGGLPLPLLRRVILGAAKTPSGDSDRPEPT